MPCHLADVGGSFGIGILCFTGMAARFSRIDLLSVIPSYARIRAKLLATNRREGVTSDCGATTDYGIGCVVCNLPRHRLDMGSPGIVMGSMSSQQSGHDGTPQS